MNGRMQTALQGGGKIRLAIDANARGNFSFEVTEDWARLTRVDRKTLTAEELGAAEDSDKLILNTCVGMVTNYISYEARNMRRHI